MDLIRISNSDLSIAIAPKGAELSEIRDAAGRDWLWNADPTFWNRHAPILFPIVGRLPDNRYRHGGRDYTLTQHGFARDREFALVARTTDAATFRLAADAATLALYPFSFELDVTFSLAGGVLEQVVAVRNTGGEPLPASIGFHPAFNWPLPGGAAAQERYVVRFEKPEPRPIRRLSGGLVGPEGHPTPVGGSVLPLDHSLFVDDAIIFDQLASRSVWFGVPGENGIRVAFPDLPFLGIWTKPGAPFLCIEPWQGHAAPLGFSGDLFDLPGAVTVPPGEERARHMSIAVGVPAA